MIHSFKNYLIEEEKTVYFTFGRMNPPTIGHEKLLDVLARKAGKNPYRIFLSQTQDKKKNPLGYAEKVKLARKMFPKHARSIMIDKKVKNVFHIMKKLNDEGYKNVVMVVGQDRLREFDILLNKYNGKKGPHGIYKFSRIDTVSAGSRDPDSEGTDGMSASKMRAAAAEKDFTSFSQGLPKSVSNPDAKGLYNKIRSAMGLKEQKEFKNYLQLEPISNVREDYVKGNLFTPGDTVVVNNTGKVAQVKHLGSNYVIIESGNREYRKWIDSVHKIEENYNAWTNKEPVEYAKHLEKTFGKPDEITDSQLCWFAKDGFKRIVIKDEYILHGSPAPHYDFIYCYIDLKVPEKYATALAESSGSIMVDFLKNEVGARCGSITANATTLNYVLDVVAERVKPSKKEYEKRILGMMKMFENGKTYTTDWWPDESEDANPKNKYYAEGHSAVCGCVIKESSHPNIWDNIRKRRAAGKPRLKPGQKGYPKTLDLPEKIEVKQDKDIDDLPGSQPASFQIGIKKKSTKLARQRQFNRQAKMADDDPSAYKDAPGDKAARKKGTKPSKYTLRFKQMYGEDKATELAKKRIEREKMADKKRHDRMLDRARLRDVRTKNRETT